MKILIATDGSDFSKAAIEKCCGMLAMEDAEIRIISVAEIITPLATEPFAISAEYIQETRVAVLKMSEGFTVEARKILEENCAGKNISVTTAVFSGSPARGIVEEAENWGADLIVIGSHGYGFWGRLVIGSVSNSVINNAPCSVLTVRKTDKAAIG